MARSTTPAPPPKKLGRPKGSKNKKQPNQVDFEKVSAAANKISSIRTKPEKHPAPFTRPPAIYSNTSPYGIAQELLWQQLKEEEKTKLKIF